MDRDDRYNPYINKPKDEQIFDRRRPYLGIDSLTERLNERPDLSIGRDLIPPGEYFAAFDESERRQSLAIPRDIRLVAVTIYDSPPPRGILEATLGRGETAIDPVPLRTLGITHRPSSLRTARLEYVEATDRSIAHVLLTSRDGIGFIGASDKVDDRGVWYIQVWPEESDALDLLRRNRRY